MSKKTIICVDDEMVILTALKSELNRHFDKEYFIETAESAEEALEIIDDILEYDNDIPLIISDQIMPDMKGDEFLTICHNRLPDSRKILLTGQADAIAVGSAVNNAGLYRYISKPWEETDLILTVKEAVRSYWQNKKLKERNKELSELNRTLEKKVKKRASEVIRLSDIGKQITATLSIDVVVDTVYKNMLDLMDSSVFAVGVYDSESNGLICYGVENGKKLNNVTVSLDYKDFPAVKCFKECKIVLLNKDIDQNHTIIEHLEIKPVDNIKSVVYLPLVIKEKVIGVITVQSFNEDAYSSYHINILQNIAVYTSIALENANVYNQIEEQKNKILVQRDNLTELNEEINQQKEELTATLEDLKSTQTKLIESEKMASLGNLVAGVAHELNTPVGIVVQATSGIVDRTKAIADLLKNKQMKRSNLIDYLEFTFESARLALSNIQRTADLVKNFKQVSVDQSTEQLRIIYVKKYFTDILLTLKSKFKGKNIQLQIDCDEDLKIKSYAGAFAQILTNLIVNSLIHGFERLNDGLIKIIVKKQKKQLHLLYSDNGKGMDEKVRQLVFEPFYTTNKQTGTGLGMHIVYNLVTQNLNGEIICKSKPEYGVTFSIKIPIL